MIRQINLHAAARRFPFVGFSKTLALVCVAMVVCSAGTAQAQRTTVSGTLAAVSILEPGDLGAYMLRFRSNPTPASNQQADPGTNNCTYGVVYFGTNGNPTPADRAVFAALTTHGLTATPLTLTYNKTTTAAGGGFVCLSLRIDASF